MSHDVYDQIAERFARQAADNRFNATYERPTTLSLLPEVRGLRVLDAGCGPGLYARELADRGAHVTGVDASSEMVRIARAHVPEATFVHADLAAPLPFPDASFDLAIAPLSLDYVADWRPPMRELARVLVPGARFVLSVPHPVLDLELTTLSRYLETEEVECVWPSFEVRMRFWRRPFGELVNPLIEAGFAIERVLEPPIAPELKPAFLWVVSSRR